jgi:hypothetical protein
MDKSSVIYAEVILIRLCTRTHPNFPVFFLTVILTKCTKKSFFNFHTNSGLSLSSLLKFLIGDLISNTSTTLLIAGQESALIWNFFLFYSDTGLPDTGSHSLHVCTGLEFIWRTSYRAGIFKQSVGTRNRGGIGLSYWPASLHRLAEFIPWNRSGLHKRLKIPAQDRAMSETFAEAYLGQGGTFNFNKEHFQNITGKNNIFIILFFMNRL